MDSDVEIISPPQNSRPAARRSLDNNTSSRSRSRSAMLKNRMRSRTATNRSRPNDRKVSRPSATTSSARRSAKNQRLVDEPLSKRGAARGEGKSVSRVNGKMAKKSAARRQASAKNSTQTDNDHGRSLRSARNDEDRDRIDFLSIFNLRSRQANGNENVKGILVKPKINKVRSKKVSFHLPSEETASTERNNSASKGGNSSKPSKGEDSSKSAAKSSSRPSKEDSLPQLEIKVPPLIYFKEDSSSKSAVKVPSRSADRKRNVPTQSNKKSVPTLAKKSRSSRVPEERKSESEDEVIDENPFDKLEELVDAARRTVDVWFECQCCNQKYYLIENAKQHVRTHFPNCLTN